MWIEHSRRILRMELSADIPFLLRDLNYLYQVGCRVDTYTLHAVILELLLVLVVELIAMAMTLLDENLFAVSLIYSAAFLQFALVSTNR